MIEPPARNYSPWYAWMVRLMTTEVPDTLTAARLAEWPQWRQRCSERLEQLLGRLPEPVDPRFETLESVPCGTYRRDKVVFDTEAAMSVPAYLLVPEGREVPGDAVLAIHGHGPGKDHACGLVETETPGGDYAHQLALRGHVVLAPDLRCFGERADWNPPDHYACDTNLVHAVMDGWSPLTQNLWDMMRCLDVLEGHSLVDRGRIGVCGHSYGGTMALFLAAVDDRVAAAAVSGYLSSWSASHRVPWNMCGSQVLPGMLGRLEHVDVAALVAPRPLLAVTGTEDLIFPLAAAEEAVATLRLLYGQLGVGDRLVHDVFEGDHRWHGDVAYAFLDRWLNQPQPGGGSIDP
jgi:dienelactone hydrolase